jgi:hypothetical protein
MQSVDRTSKGSIPSEIVRNRIVEFFATLDIGAELAETVRPETNTLPPVLRKVFGTRERLEVAATRFAQLRDKYRDKPELTNQVATLLEKDPAHFLALAHILRQLRFTNVELVHFMFEAQRLNDPQYYEHLMESDSRFNNVVQRFERSRNWLKYTKDSNRQVARIATFKKTVSAYLGSEERCWDLWRSRIETDPEVRQRIASFVVNNEDLSDLIQQNTVNTFLQRSLRTVNVEMVKKERGGYAPRKVREIVTRAGFVEHDYGTTDISELESLLHRRPLTELPRFGYATEITWIEGVKKFDFVLIGRSQIGFVIEVNYFTTAMSKIREVLSHFKQLKQACSEKYRLIFVTDGVGWLDLAKDLERMIEFEIEQRSVNDKVPFLVNLLTLDHSIARIKEQIR